MGERFSSFSDLNKFLSQTRQSVRKIRQAVRDWQIDMVYTNTSVIHVGRVAAWLEQLPHIWHIRELAQRHFGWQFLLPKWISLPILSSSQALICVCQAAKEEYFKPDNPKARVIFNGIGFSHELDGFIESRNEASRGEVFTFGMVGSITPEKGQVQAILALAELRKLGVSGKLIIAGHGSADYEETLMKLVSDLGLGPLVEFTGYVEDAYSVYDQCDAFLMCSDYEGLSRVAIEAMSAALPVIGKKSGGTPEIIVHEETGLLYETDEELLAGMRRMVENPEWARQMGLAGWARAKEKFNIETYAENVYRVIQSVMK